MIVIDNLVIGEVEGREGRNDDDFVFDVGWFGGIEMMKSGRQKV